MAADLGWLFNLKISKVIEWKTANKEIADLCIVKEPFDTKYMVEHPDFRKGLVGVYKRIP